MSLYSERTYDTILDCFAKDTSLTSRQIIQMLRNKNEPEIDTALPWQVRYILAELGQRGALLFDPVTASYKRK